jgi:serine/threonine protein kinase
MTIKPIIVETAFGIYTLNEQLGEGGAGRVYGGASADGSQVAVKILSADKVTTDKRRRFRNEITFLARNRHPNIVSVIDHGVASFKGACEPFYVMQRYDCNLRKVLPNIKPQEVFSIFTKMLDGVEAAHLQGAVHRDLKPENILFDRNTQIPAIADFGVASFTDDIVATIVETSPAQRLANFMYAAPEQRAQRKQVGQTADIYALGLMLNEMFTSNVPHGTEYQRIGTVIAEFGFLDAIVDKMIRQAPDDRYQSIQEVKQAISAQHSEFLSLQKISQIDATVIPAGDVDDPLAYAPPKLATVDWNNGILTLTLDRTVHTRWLNTFSNLNVMYVMGAHPSIFQFKEGRIAEVPVQAKDVQQVVNYFKQWLPEASRLLKEALQREVRIKEDQLREKLRHDKAAEEERLQVFRSLRI